MKIEYDIVLRLFTIEFGFIGFGFSLANLFIEFNFVYLFALFLFSISIVLSARGIDDKLFAYYKMKYESLKPKGKPKGITYYISKVIDFFVFMTLLPYIIISINEMNKVFEKIKNKK